jgi:hypothetical protein
MKLGGWVVFGRRWSRADGGALSNQPQSSSFVEMFVGTGWSSVWDDGEQDDQQQPETETETETESRFGPTDCFQVRRGRESARLVRRKPGGCNPRRGLAAGRARVHLLKSRHVTSAYPIHY